MPSCPNCEEELGSGDPTGLCASCVIQGAFYSSVGAGDESRTQTIDTASAEPGDDDFGRYQILRPLGEGGMGTVYLAEQREPIRRYVALKVVKLGMDTSQLLARFGNERQALAMMDHPNIARIFDAGATPKGRPYFVMEYMEGVPITQYCDGKRMAIGQRLELFLAVCRAVQHAHQKGVIHRDLKPSNVLVVDQEGTHVPKVIDFGIAKAADQWAVANTLLTQFGQMVGTPEYASPEQAHSIEANLDKRYPEDTSVQFSYLPALRALEALNQGDAAKALEMTQLATPYDLAVPATAFYDGAFFGALYPVYVRGLAYSRMGRHREAAAEFQKILDHPGITLNDPIGPMARLQLARASFASGDRAKSAAAYKELLALWKDADPDIPAVQAAKAESLR